MPIVGDNDEALYERAMFVKKSGVWIPLELDSDGYLEVTMPSVEVIEVKQADASLLLATVDVADDQNIQSRGYGWVNSDWQKQNINLGYSGTIAKTWNDVNLAAGTNLVDSTTVPSGELWVISNVTFLFLSATITRVLIRVSTNGSVNMIYGHTSPATNTPYYVAGSWVLEPTDFIRVEAQGATSGDDMYCELIGHRVDIDQ